MSADDTHTPSGRPTPPSAARTRGFRMGRILGVPIYITTSWFVLAVVVTIWYEPVVREGLPQLSQAGAYAMSAGFVVCLLVSVLLHELGHALTARGFKMGVRAITL